MKKWNLKLALFMLSAILLIAGCSANSGSNEASPGASASASASGSAGAETSGEKVLTIANVTDIESFDIHNNNNTVSESVLINMFDYLISNAADGSKQPGLALSWEQVDDTTWRFKLRDDVKFHNGDPFTSADVKFTLERVAKDSALKQNSLYKQIASVNIVDEYTVDIVTEIPDPILVNRLSRMGSGMLPSKYIEENGMDAFLANPVGTGPYKFQSWAKDDRVVMAKNEDYYGGEPAWDKIVFRAIPEATTRVSELLTGGIDIAANIPSTDINRIEATEGLSVAKTPIQRVLQVILRHTEGAVTADPNVREAIDLAIDKKSIVDSIAGGAGVLTRTSVTPGNFGADESLYNQSLYDPERAAELMETAGYSESNPAKVTLSAQSQYKEYAEVVAAYLSRVGFEVTLDILESSAFSEKMSSKTFGEMFLIGIGNSMFDASNNYNRFLFERAAGETDYNNPQVEELLRAAEQNMDPESREEQFKQVQQILKDDRPAVYLFQMEGLYGVGSNVEFAPRKDEMYYVQEIAQKA